MKYRKHKEGHMVIAVGSAGSTEDLKNRGFLPEDFPSNWHITGHQMDHERFRSARKAQELFDGDKDVQG